jgi:type I restriction enzyme S subunit
MIPTFYKEIHFKETRIGEMPRDWEVARLGDVVLEAKSGFASGKRNPNGILQLRMDNIDTQGHIRRDAGVKVPVPKDFEDYLLQPEDILFNNTNSVDMIGKTAIFKGEFSRCVYSNHLTRIRADTRKIIATWILYLLMRKRRFGVFKSICHRHVHQAGINNEDLLNLDIPIPPLVEQRGVVGVLGVVDSAVGLVDEVIAKTERLKKGLMQELLTKGIGHTEYKQTPIGKTPKEWEVKSLEEVCTTIVDCPHTTPKFTDKGVLIVRNFNIREGELILEPAYYTTEGEWQTRTRRCIPENDDVLFSREAPIGEACLVPRNTRFSLGQRTMLLRPDKKFLNPLFLTYIFYSPLICRKLRNLEAGVTAHHVNVADIRRLKIPLPNLNEQERIAFMISTVIEKLKLEKKENAKLERVKRGLMDLFLTGKIRIKVD